MEQLRTSLDSIAYFIVKLGLPCATVLDYRKALSKWYNVVNPTYINPVYEYVKKMGHEQLADELDELISEINQLP